MKDSKTPTAHPRTLSIGGATYDLFVRTGPGVTEEDHGKKILALPLGAKIRVEQVLETCGGGASNTAVGLSRLGCMAHFCGILGSDQWGERMLKNFEKEGVNAKCATIVEGETSSFSIILSSESGERVILYDPGTNAHLHDANFDREHAATMDWLYLNHIHERSCVIEDDIVAILKKNPRIGLTWNPGGSQLKTGIADASIRQLLAETDLLVCNKEEAMLFTGEKDTDTAITTLLKLGVRVACICDGRRGSIGADKDHRFHCPIRKDAPVIETTGAGDAFGTGATYAMMQGLALPEILRAGTISAASVIGAIGAQAGLLTDIEMHKQLKDVRLDVEEQ